MFDLSPLCKFLYQVLPIINYIYVSNWSAAHIFSYCVFSYKAVVEIDKLGTVATHMGVHVICFYSLQRENHVLLLLKFNAS